MKPTKPYLIFVLFMVLLLHSIMCATSFILEEENYSSDHDDSLSGADRSLLQKKRTIRTLRLTCNKFPRMCNFKGSPGTSCCKKKCVNLLKDRQNCGKCGKKCKYNEICCNGKCVNPSFNRRHCGGCNNSCNKGEFCVLGLCNYA